MKVTTPYHRVTEVNNCRIFSMYIKTGLALGIIPYSLFNEKLTLNINDKTDLVIQASSKSKATINGVADNLRLITTGNCFVAIDEALDEFLGVKPVTYLDNDLDSLRAITYMARCAYAHNPASPVWHIKPKYRKIFEIKSLDLTIDFKQLDGKKLDFDHFGGIKSVHQLILHSLAILKQYDDQG